MTLQASAGVSSGSTPPQNLDAEVAVLGALMVSVEAMERVSDILRPTYFYSPQHADIYGAAYELHKRGDPVDILTLNAELDKLGLLERVGGTDYLANLESGGGIAANVESYARLVEETAVRRGLLAAGRMIEGLGHDAGLDIDEALDAAGTEILRLADERTTHEAVRLSDALGDTWERLERLHENPDLAPGVRSGFVDLDAKTAGFQPGTLTIIAARPSVGKTSLALNIAQHAALKEKVPVAVFSLEMSRWELTQRLLSGEAGVDSYLLRTGKIADSDWPKIANAMGALSEGEIYIDDRPGATVLDMRAKARRLKMQKKIGLIVIDYVQLMSGSGRPENRTQEVSEISRSLKRLSVELDIPVIALSQLSRAPEQRGDHRPQLSDLRESGCLTGDSLVYLPDTGAYERIASLVGKTGFNVMALNRESWKLEPRPVTNAFSTGRKPIFELKTKLGRSIRATRNHKFLTIDGWRRLDSLRPGDHLAMPRWLTGPTVPTMSEAELALLGHLIGDGCTLPSHAIQYTTREMSLAEIVCRLAREVFGDRVSPRIHPEREWFQVYLPAAFRLTHRVRNPVAAWLDEMDAFGFRSHEKRIPARVFAQPLAGIAVFLRHLWSTDGCIRPVNNIYYATSSSGLATDVQSLLLRLGVNAVVRRYGQGGKGRDQYHVLIMGKAEIERFLQLIGTVNDERLAHKVSILMALAETTPNTNRDVIPSAFWRQHAVPAMTARGITSRGLQSGLGMQYCGTGLYRQNVSRERAARVASVVGSPELVLLSESDVYWDQIDSIEAGGVEEVYDLTVDGLHNFVVNDVIAHNSLEQDSDVVIFLYREGLHNPEVKRNKAELIISKHRNGPIGEVPLIFLESQTRFVSATRQAPPMQTPMAAPPPRPPVFDDDEDLD
jgi:replicative DNA helicase